jgi:hypothetical protein
MECNSGQVAPGSTYKVILGSTSLIDQQLILFIYLFSIKLFVGEILTQGTTNIFWYYPSTVTRFIIFIIYIYIYDIYCHDICYLLRSKIHYYLFLPITSTIYKFTYLGTLYLIWL